MRQTTGNGFIIDRDDPILITGATGFIGPSVVANLLDRGFRNLRCLVRPSSNVARLQTVVAGHPGAHVELIPGNLLSRDDCRLATKDVAVVFHLAMGGGAKSFPDAFMSAAVATRNLVEACLAHNLLRRFVNMSSFTVYSNMQKPRWRLLDESCPIEEHPELRWDAYCFGKVKQDEVVTDYARRFQLPYVIVRPGYVYGPGHEDLSGRVGIGTFGVFLHLGGSNPIPFTHVENCADAMVLAGLTKGVDGQVFNVVDDDLPSSRQFLRLYKKNVRRFPSIAVPHAISYALCYLWERYSNWSEGQLPPAFNRRKWHAFWKKTRYSNERLKTQLGWTPRVSTSEGFRRYFESCRNLERHA